MIEFVGIGPGPFAGMMLVDQGADVISVDRSDGQFFDPRRDVLMRSRTSIAIDLKTAAGIEIVRDLCRSADAIIEGYRPGVMERLGLGPEVLHHDNPKLVYGRITGWGQQGPLAKVAGHDINYTALSGSLHAFGRAGEKPTPPINLVGDFGGGGMLLAFGILAGILKVRDGGDGEVIDCAMVDGAALLMASIWGMRTLGAWTDARGTNLLDTGAHFYDTYECADGHFVAIGAIEPQFYAAMCRFTGLEAKDGASTQMDRDKWPQLKEQLASIFRQKTRAEWCALMEGSESCFAPVLSMAEAPTHPHNVVRASFIDVGGDIQPGPAPRFSGSIPDPPRPGRAPGADTRTVLAQFGYSADRIDALCDAGAVFERTGNGRD